MNLEKGGKIISIIGSPAAGKTFLADKLAAHYHGVAIYEQPPEGFPEQIMDNLQTQSNLFETIVWFRNIQIEHYNSARTMASEGKIVIMDTAFYQNQFFVNQYIQDDFLKKILFKMGDIDRSLFKQPDCTIYISSTPQTAQEFLSKRRGDRKWENDQWVHFITSMPPLVEDYVASIKQQIPNLININRAEHDFAIEGDLKRLIEKIDSHF